MVNASGGNLGFCIAPRAYSQHLSDHNQHRMKESIMRGEWSLLENKKRKLFLFFFKQCEVLGSIQNLHIWKPPYFLCLHVQCKMYWVPLGVGLKNGIFSEIYQSTVDLQCYVNFICTTKLIHLHTHVYIHSFPYSFLLCFITGY